MEMSQKNPSQPCVEFESTLVLFAAGELSPVEQANVTGHVYALDAKDGHVVWKFDVVPKTGPARATWTATRGSVRSIVIE